VIHTSHSSSLGLFLTLVKNFFSSAYFFRCGSRKKQKEKFGSRKKQKEKFSWRKYYIDSVNEQPTTSRLLRLNKVGGTTISSSPARNAMKREWFPAGSSSPPGDRLQIVRRTSSPRLQGTGVSSFFLFA
jgi:hypothetical protein